MLWRWTTPSKGVVLAPAGFALFFASAMWFASGVAAAAAVPFMLVGLGVMCSGAALVLLWAAQIITRVYGPLVLLGRVITVVVTGLFNTFAAFSALEAVSMLVG